MTVPLKRESRPTTSRADMGLRAIDGRHGMNYGAILPNIICPQEGQICFEKIDTRSSGIGQPTVSS